MIMAFTAIVVTSIVLSWSSAYLAARSAPRHAVIVCTLASLIVASASSGILAIAAWYGVARLASVARLGEWSASLLGRRSPLPVAASSLAGLCLAYVAVAVAFLFVGHLVDLRRARRALPMTPASDPVVVLRQSEVDAFALDGTRPNRRVVVTEGLLQELRDPQLLEAVLAHERAHLRHHHILYRIIVRVSATANPFLLPVVAVVEDAIEAWADDDAASTAGRCNVAAALSTVALARARARTPRMALGVSGSGTVKRVERLLNPTAVSRTGLYVAAGASITAAIAIVMCSITTETFFEALRAASLR